MSVIKDFSSTHQSTSLNLAILFILKFPSLFVSYLLIVNAATHRLPYSPSVLAFCLNFIANVKLININTM